MTLSTPQVVARRHSQTRRALIRARFPDNEEETPSMILDVWRRQLTAHKYFCISVTAYFTATGARGVQNLSRFPLVPSPSGRSLKI